MLLNIVISKECKYICHIQLVKTYNQKDVEN
jgi:hypothetical protein